MHSSPLNTSSADQTNAFLAAIVESSDDAIISKTLEGIITSWNKGAERIFGYTADEMIGKPLLTLIPPERANEEAEILAALRRGERIDHYETVRVRKDGARLDISVTVSPVRNAEGVIIGASKIARDITERKRIREALRAAEQHFRSTISQVKDHAIFSTDPSGIIHTWNDGCKTILGYDLDELLGLDASRLFTTEDVASGVPAQELKTAAERGTASNDRWMLRKNGKRFWASGTTSGLRDSAGNLMGFTMVLRDMTEHQRKEEQIRRSIRRFELISNAARNLLEMHDPLALLDRIYGQLAAPYGLDFYFHFIAESGGPGLRLCASRGIPTDQARQIENLAFGEDTSAIRASELKPIIIPNVLQSEHSISRLLREFRITAYACHPLVSDEQLLGTLSFGTHRESGFDPELIEIIRALTDMVATAIARQQAEQTAEKSVAELRLVIEAAPNGMVMVDEHGVITMVNAQTEQLFGYHRAEMLGQPIEMLLPERYRKRHPGQRQDFFRSPTTRAMGHGRDLFARRKDGSEFPVEVGLNPTRTPDGMVVLAAIIDITERKKTEEALSKSAAQFRLVVESAPNGMVMVDERGIIVMVNSQMERLFGYDRAEMLDQPIEMLLPERYRARHPAQRKEFFHSPLTRAMGHGRDLFARRKDGSEFPVEVGLNPATTSDGMVVLAAVIDITERKRMELELAKAHDDLSDYARNLEEMVAERTSRLRASIAELEAFSYSLAHDLRAPLRSIQSFSQIVLEEAAGRLGDQQTELLQKIVRAGSRLDQLINDVLAYTRLAREEIELKSVDLESLVRQIIAERPELQPPAAQIEIASPLLRVRGHESSLTQCITNLLDNAVKFVAPGAQPHVRIWSEPFSGMVRVWFEDNGIGIPADFQQRIFGIFQRLHSDQTYPGTGIGLAIVRKAVERMHGTVGVESNEVGSRFWLQLPRDS